MCPNCVHTKLSCSEQIKEEQVQNAFLQFNLRDYEAAMFQILPNKPVESSPYTNKPRLSLFALFVHQSIDKYKKNRQIKTIVRHDALIDGK